MFQSAGFEKTSVMQGEFTNFKRAVDPVSTQQIKDICTRAVLRATQVNYDFYSTSFASEEEKERAFTDLKMQRKIVKQNFHVQLIDRFVKLEKQIELIKNVKLSYSIYLEGELKQTSTL